MFVRVNEDARVHTVCMTIWERLMLSSGRVQDANDDYSPKYHSHRYEYQMNRYFTLSHYIGKTLLRESNPCLTSVIPATIRLATFEAAEIFNILQIISYQ